MAAGADAPSPPHPAPPPPSGPVCPARIHAERSTFSPKITFPVRLPSCPPPPPPPSRRHGGTTCHAGGGRTQMAHQMCGPSTREEARGCAGGPGADAAGPRARLIGRVASEGQVRASGPRYVHPCPAARLLVASPHRPADPQLAAPPLPAAAGAPPGPAAWQSGVLGPPTSPPWQLLPSAVPAQTAPGSGKVTPPAAGLGGWLGGARRLLKDLWTRCGVDGAFTAATSRRSFGRLAGAAAFKRMIVSFNILIIRSQGGFQSMRRTSEGRHD